MIKIVCDGCNCDIEDGDVGQTATCQADLQDMRLRVTVRTVREDADAAANLCVDCLRRVFKEGRLAALPVDDDAEIPDVTPSWLSKRRYRENLQSVLDAPAPPIEPAPEPDSLEPF